MKALVCDRLGPPETLTVRDVPDPVPGKGELLIRVSATGLNFFDTLIIEGKYQVKPEPPFSPGGECVGFVEAVGANVEGFTRGERVIASVPFGACAQLVVTKAEKATPIDDKLSDEVAAGLTITYGTTIHALKDRASLQGGETLAVLGASGGVGLAAIEVGKAMGARVVACASSDEKLKIAREHGADALINYAEKDLKAALKAEGGETGIDVVYDPVGGDLAEAAIRSLGWKGRFLVIGFASGTIPKIPLNLALLKGCDIQGVFWGRFLDEEPQKARTNLRQLVAWCDIEALSPRVDQVFSLTQAVDGLRRLAARQAVGKIVVKPHLDA
ncbi:MAG: NADPH:quinone oxidoreductase family protein [Pseudomonadota bacterium]